MSKSRTIAIQCDIEKEFYTKNVTPFYSFEDKENISTLRFYDIKFKVEKKEKVDISIDDYERWNISDPNKYKAE